MSLPLRRLGRSEVYVSPLALGGWPISGMTSLGVTDAAAVATIAACFEVGVNFIDTAYCYGAAGESERLIARAIGARRSEIVIATKGGIHWDDTGKQVKDARPATLRRQCEESLRRLATDYVDLLYLHAPDPQTPLGESAAELRRLLEEGKTRAVGASNVTAAQCREFAEVCPLSAVQPHYNMLQREIEAELLPWCLRENVAACVYWPLLKGLLAGKLPREHVFQPGDGRAKYPMFQGAEWQRNQDLIDDLRPIAAEAGVPLSAMVLAWTIRRPGITAALVGAKRPDQLRENAAALSFEPSPEQLSAIDAALARRGTPVSRAAV